MGPILRQGLDKTRTTAKYAPGKALSVLVTVNDAPTELPDGCSLTGLISHLGLDRAICAAEVNQALVPRDRRDETVLAEGDRVEIVTLVGGG